MSSVVNLLSTESTQFLSSTGSWTSATNQLSVTRSKIRTESNSSSLKIYDSTGNGASALVEAAQILSTYHDWPIRAFAWVDSEVSGTATIYLTYVSGGASTTVSEAVPIIADNWTLLSVTQDSIPDDTENLILRVVSTDTNAGDSIYISRPAIMSPWAASQSVAGGEVWLRLPEYLRATDKNQTDPDVPLFRFIEALFSTANSIDESWQDFRWIPPEDNNKIIKESGLVSPNTAIPSALIWMAQVIGSTLLDPTAAYTPWIFLDTDNNPLTPFTWAEWKSALDDNADGTLTWQEIQDFNPAIFDLTTSFRAQVTGAFYGYKAGTNQSFVKAAQTVTNVSTVTVFSRYLDDPFHIKVEILISEGGNTVDVERALVGTTPAGFQVTVVAV